jgi:putative transposon-encoded protein
MEKFIIPELEYDNNSNIYGKAKFEVLGEEMIEKKVNSSGNSGRIYLPPEWIGIKVKVIKL